MVHAVVRAAHAGPTAVVTLLSAAMLAGFRASPGVLALATGAVLAGQLSVGWSNDWVDADRDRTVGRVDKPVVTGAIGPGTLRTAALVAAGACVVLSFAMGVLPGALHVAAVVSAWGYNLRLKRTVWSWLPYAVSFGLLPAFLATAVDAGDPVPWRLVAAGALLGAGAHVANALPDLEDDVATGVRGLPHRLGRRRSALVAPVLLVAATLLVAGGGPLRVVTAGTAVTLAVAAGLVGVVRPASRTPFGLSMAVAAVCVLLLATAASDRSGGPGADGAGAVGVSVVGATMRA